MIPFRDSSDDPQRADRKSARRRRRRRRRAQAIAILPSLFTLGNLIAGFAAIHYAAKSPAETTIPVLGLSTLMFAGLLVFVGMFFDAIDGYIARLTRATSDLGAQLDSLADIVTFGVAPAYMTLQLVSRYYFSDGGSVIIGPERDDAFARIFWVIAAIYVSCTALRLARYNVETPSTSLRSHMVFRGLPSPGAAGCVVSLILLHQKYLSGQDYEWAARVTGFGMAFILLLCAVAMVSRLPYVHVMNRYVRGHASFGYIVKLAFILAAAAIYRIEALALGFTLYAITPPIRTAIASRQMRRAAETLFPASRPPIVEPEREEFELPPRRRGGATERPRPLAGSDGISAASEERE